MRRLNWSAELAYIILYFYSAAKPEVVIDFVKSLSDDYSTVNFVCENRINKGNVPFYYSFLGSTVITGYI